MRILIASAVFPPEPVVSARLSKDLQEHLRSIGHEPWVICPRPSRGVERSQPESARREEGVVRLDSYHCRESRLIGRARESWDLGVKTARWLRAEGRSFDVLYANVWPLFASWHITKAAARLGIPVVLHVQDMYPESLATKVPLALYRLAAPLLMAMDRRVVQRCARVVLLSQRISRAYARTRGITDRVHVVRNWVDGSGFTKAYNRAEVCQEYSVPEDCFTYMYLGNLSALSALDSVIRAFARTTSSGRQLVIVGEGSVKAECQELVRNLGLKNVLFRSEPDAQKVARIQTMADVFLMPTRRGGATSSTPSKCISYMFSGQPVLAAVDAESDAADDIRSADCGWVCEPENDEAIAALMERCASLPAATLAGKGSRARAYAQATFGREAGVKALSEIILGVARGGKQ